ncbi:hypothetical protein EG329_007577, partial [Mollisiaceae sp. DMI_Dod_QoI]
MDSLGAAAAILQLIGTAITIVQQIQIARKKVKGVSKTLDNVSTQLDKVSKSLEFLKEEPRLRTESVGQQVVAIVDISTEMNLLFDKLQAEQKKSAVRQFTHALNSGDKEDKELVDLVNRLSNARQELILRVSVVNVGLIGNVNDGFQVSQHVVMEINENVKRVLGTQLVLAERLQQRDLTTTSQETVQLNDLDAVALGLRSETSTGDRQQVKTSDENLKWQNNKTDDEPRIFTGNMGLEDHNSANSVRATVQDSEFGKKSRFMFGH